MDVSLLRWPTETARRESLIAEGVPRLLLVEPGEEPPLPADCLEDWARVPASEDDVRARTAGLEVRNRVHNHVVPELDGHGVLRAGTDWVPLPPVEARLTGALLNRFGAVVSRESLSRAGWPGGAPGRSAFDVHVLRLRRRLSPLGLAIRTVRSRGYLLETASRQALEA
jgi:two-component system, OmpR family, response regulator